MTFRTRFAPSPTGPLHLGHAYSALLAHDLARAHGGDFVLRIEDIDRARSKPEWEAQIYDDLTWLGLAWPQPVLRQSTRLADYRAAVETLWRDDLTFACICTRRDIVEAASAPQEGIPPPTGPDGVVYPGTCRGRTSASGARTFPAIAAARLNVADALQAISESGPLSFIETGRGPDGETGLIEFDAREVIEDVGDVVLARRDMGTSYHLAVVLDDAAQAITHVVRGADLFQATRIHVVLQRLLGLTTPTYHHHQLIRDAAGKRLAKRDDARAIRHYRDEGANPADIRAMVGLQDIG